MYRRTVFFITAMILFQASVARAETTRTVLKIGYFQNEPIVFKGLDGSPKGLYIDLIREIARIENWDITFVFGDWSQCIRRLDEGEIDLMTSIAVTKQRERRYAFSKINILSMWGQVYARPGNRIENIMDLEGQQVAILGGGINGINFQTMARGFGVTCRLIPADTYDAVARMVMDGRAAAGVINNVNGRIVQEKFDLMATPIMFSPFRLLFAAPRDSRNEACLKRIDHHLDQWKRNKDSFYYQRMNHWYGQIDPAVEALPKWVAVVLFFGTLVIVISLLWSKTLSTQIRERKQAEREKERLIVKLQNALTEIKTLEGIVPICAKCKSIRDDEGYWNLLESYIEARSDAMFSHGLCPDCSDEMYGKEEWYQRMKKNKSSGPDTT